MQNEDCFSGWCHGNQSAEGGHAHGVCPEAWILEHPDTMMQLQRAYFEAGSDIVLAPTFTANRIKLDEYGLVDKIEEMNHQLVAISKEAAGDKGLVAGDMTMTGRQLAPMGDMGFEELVDIYKEQAGYLVDAGVDLFIVETMMSLNECRAALIAIREVTDLPVCVTLSFNEDGRTLFGTEPAQLWLFCSLLELMRWVSIVQPVRNRWRNLSVR